MRMKRIKEFPIPREVLGDRDFQLAGMYSLKYKI